jgi:2-polyprenyl-3-methyl-5-hydroxy-6-metoxy-1,4-benzoquinol methylase
VRCHVCGSAVSIRIYRSRRTGLSAQRCAGCRLVAVDEGQVPEEVHDPSSEAAKYANYLSAQRTDGLRERHLTALHRMMDGAASERPRLFDVGAGAGDFLGLARAEGFEVAGNEISKAAIETCRERHGIELHHGDIAALDLDGQFDAMTMWCVLAHVPEPAALLSDAFRLLRPGGLLYFHTPRWCAIDQVGLAALRATGGRVSHVMDRRITRAHRRLYDRRNLAALLMRVGFAPVTVEPVAGYSLRTRSYLSSMGLPAAVCGPVAGIADAFVERGWIPRNILDVYAVKPLPQSVVLL